MKKLSLLLLLIFVGCQSMTPEPTIATQVQPPTTIPYTTTAEPSATTIFIEPTASFTATPIPEAQIKIRNIMTEYGHVDEKYLAPQYWDKMAADIAAYGPAKRILALEFHGDNYYMYDGSYSMTPESFVDQMTLLMDNNFHFVTGPELLGFLEGWLQLPARSVILTTDSGAGSMNSMPRIIQEFRKLERKYGYTPHMQSYIWTYGMTEQESIRCKKNICWEAFREYLKTGYFTFGSHTESHSDFSKFTREQTVYDLTTNVAKIRENLGLNVYGLTWPFEACSPYEDLVRAAGIKYGYGGWTRETIKLYTYQSDNMPLCLPRVFPPNPDGYSGRPNGRTFEEMLSDAMNLYAPIQ